MNDHVQVHFIGAGPGDSELITVKGARLVAGADLVLYAGSLVPPDIVASAKPGARVVDSAPLALEETHAEILQAVDAHGPQARIARVHAGDPSLYGAVAEQARLLERDGISWAVVPGVTSAAAAAAAAKVPFTVPDGTQSLIFTRLAGRTPVPESEDLTFLAGHGSAMAIFLSAGQTKNIQERLLAGGYPPETPIVLAHRVGWADERVVHGHLKDLIHLADENSMSRQTVFLIVPQGKDSSRSKLYDPEFKHGFRP